MKVRCSLLRSALGHVYYFTFSESFPRRCMRQFHISRADQGEEFGGFACNLFMTAVMKHRVWQQSKSPFPRLICCGLESRMADTVIMLSNMPSCQPPCPVI